MIYTAIILKIKTLIDIKPRNFFIVLQHSLICLFYILMIIN